MISRVRENSEVVIIYPDLLLNPHRWYLHQQLPPGNGSAGETLQQRSGVKSLPQQLAQPMEQHARYHAWRAHHGISHDPADFTRGFHYRGFMGVGIPWL